MRNQQPLLVIVNGRPCTGKTTLASILSRDLRIPMFSKDAIKEKLGESLGAEDRSASRRLGAAAIALMYQQAEILLTSGLPAMVESPLISELAEKEIEELQSRTNCRILQVFLRAEPSVILERFRSRPRKGVFFHHEELRELEATVTTELAPVTVAGKTIFIDTTDFRTVDFARISERVRCAHLDGQVTES